MWSKILVFLCLPVTASFVYDTQAQTRAFSVADSVRMTRFNTPSENLKTDAPLFSPDGRFLLVITSRGLIRPNKIESSLWLYRTEEVRNFIDHGGTPPQRRLIARVSAIPESETPSAHAPVVTQVKWARDSQRLYFLAETIGGKWQLCRVNLRNGAVELLSRPSENVRYYSFTPSATVYLSTIPVKQVLDPDSMVSQKSSAVAESIRGRSVESLLIANDPGHPVLAQLWKREGEKLVALGKPYVDAGFGGAYTPDVLVAAPDGRTIIHSRPAVTVPPSWQRYVPVGGFPTLRIDPLSANAHSPYNLFRPRQFVLIDVATRHERPVVNAPIAYTLGYSDQQSVVWSKDGRKALLTGTFLSPSSEDPGEADGDFTHPCAAAILDAVSEKIQCVASSRWDLLDQRSNDEALLLTSATLDDFGNSVTLRFEYPGRRSVLERYALQSGRWVQTLRTSTTVKAASTAETQTHEISMTVRQAVDRQPVLWASDASHQEGRLIWNPNPELASVRMGEASIFRWKDANGYNWTGGLIKPVGFVAGKRYPLIIQTHGFQAYRFLTDGFYPTAMAALPLASDGFMVLQVETRRTHYTTSEEVEDQLEGIDAAIDRLNEAGWIDPEGVGIAGFSRTCWYVESALVKKPHRFAAATIADGVDQGYVQYALFGDTPNMRADSETIHGGKPYADNIRNWVQHAPPFQSDVIRTPLLIQALGTRSILMEWEIYASLYQQGKAVDLIYLPNAQHVLQRPDDLVASEQAVVDWFRFWIQNYESSDPKLAAQYARWRALKLPPSPGGPHS